MIYSGAIKKFNLLTSVLNVPIQDLPNDCVYKMVSHGDFSSASIILFISKFTKINRLYVTTLRVGQKELKMMDMLNKMGKLDYCNIVVGSIAKDDKKQAKYNYYNNLQNVCLNNHLELSTDKNHSKLLLFDTDNGKFVLETSSNLNENPKTEQFSLEKNKELFDFYLSEIWKL